MPIIVIISLFDLPILRLDIIVVKELFLSICPKSYERYLLTERQQFVYLFKSKTSCNAADYIHVTDPKWLDLKLHLFTGIKLQCCGLKKLTLRAIFLSLFIAENCFRRVRTAESRGLSGATPST